MTDFGDVVLMMLHTMTYFDDVFGLVVDMTSQLFFFKFDCIILKGKIAG